MAIFDKAGSAADGTSGATIIAQCTSIKGEINTNCSVHIDGSIEGDIISTSVVTIGKSGNIVGTVKANSLIVSGRVEGIADCDNIEILPNGLIQGKVITNELVIEKQGFFEGESRKKDDLEDNTNKQQTQETKQEETE